MPNPKGQLPDQISTAEFAELVDLTIRRIQQLQAENILPKGGHGKIPFKEGLRAYVTWRLAREKREKEAARALDPKTDEQVRKLRLANDEIERRLIKIEDAMLGIDAIYGIVQAELSSAAAAITDDVGLRRKIEDAHHDILASISRRTRETALALRAGDDPFTADGEDSAD